MRLLRWGLFAGGLLLLAAALFQSLLPVDVWNQRGGVQVKGLSGAQQEVALIEPATNGDDWERLVSAVPSLQRGWRKRFPDRPALQVSLERAFPRLTADVPEIGLAFADSPEQQLLVRWYKISGEHDTASWVDKLRRRLRPPLAV